MAGEVPNKAEQIAAFKDWLRKAKNDPYQASVNVFLKATEYGLDVSEVTEVITALENENN
ncbi:MAG TPA: hypothetical protein VFG51_03505 [Candidatus Saccharimonadia bacterium]|nr:hypothetical protein [Candidatus Saccharimonadia bacterium]